MQRLPVSAGGTGASSLTGYVKGNGSSAFTATPTIPAADIAAGVLKMADGSAAAPAYSFSSDPDCGLYRIGANQIGIAVGGTLIVDIQANDVRLTNHQVMENGKILHWKGTGGVATPVLQKFTDDNVYLDNYTGAVLLRGGSAGVLSGSVSVLNGGAAVATQYLAAGNGAAVSFGKFNPTLAANADLDIANGFSGLFVVRNNTDGGVAFVNIEHGLGVYAEVSDPSAIVTVGADPGAGSNQLWVTSTGTTIRVRNRYGASKSVSISCLMPAGTPS